MLTWNKPYTIKRNFNVIVNVDLEMKIINCQIQIEYSEYIFSDNVAVIDVTN